MGSSAQHYVVAVDGGGSGCRVALHDANGRSLATAEGGPANMFTDTRGAIRNILSTITDATTQAGLKPRDLKQSVAHIGLAGVMDQADSDAVAAAMPFERVTVSDDRATSVAGALGDRDGVLAAVGTGTFVAAQSGDTVRYFGGWGYQLSDQASGSWLGRAALQRAILAYDGLMDHSDLTRDLLDEFGGTPVNLVHFAKTAQPADIAAYAPRIVDAANQGDVHAGAIMQGGAEYLMSCLRAAQFKPGTVLCLAGGVGPHYQRYFDPELHPFIQPPAGTALDGALHLAQQLLAKMNAVS